MARGKEKESALTPEEKLAQALVPDWEQPYKVPKNWIWSYIRYGYEVTSSKRVHKDDWLPAGIPFYRTRELVKLSEHGYVDNELFISEEQYEEYKTAYGVPQMGDLLISGVGTIGVPYIVNSEEKFYFKDGNIIWFKNKGLFLPEYIYFLYKSLFMDNQIHEMSSGTTVDTYTIINANNTMVPIPPLSEQQRIVDRIEYLFTKLDEAKEKVQSVLDNFETRKAAILHKAFTGELTAKWRAEHGLEKNSWQFKPWGELISSIEAGKNWNAEGRPPQGAEFGVVKVSSVTWGEFDELESKTCVVQDQWNEKVQIKSGDFLFSRANTLQLVGNCVIVKNITRRLMLSDKILRFSFTDAVNPYYVLFYTRSKLYRQQAEQQASGNQDGMRNISQKNLRLIEIPMPSFMEQEEIVRILDSLFAKEQQAKEAAEAVLEKIDLLKKSILARAFRGELGTNDPTEESALKLLQNLLGLPAEDKAPAKRVFIPQDIENRINTELERKIIKMFLQKKAAVMPVSKLMSASSKKLDIMEALRNLQQRGILAKEKDTYKLLR